MGVWIAGIARLCTMKGEAYQEVIGDINRDHIAQCLDFGVCAPLVDPCHGGSFHDDRGL